MGEYAFFVICNKIQFVILLFPLNILEENSNELKIKDESAINPLSSML